LGAAENGKLPSFYEGVDLRLPDGAILPPLLPGNNVKEDASGTGFTLISNKDIHEADLPPREADYEAQVPFCLSYDGYAKGLRTIKDCGEIADNSERKGLQNCSMDELRITALIRQRAAKNHDLFPVPQELVRSIRAAIDEIRNRVVHY
jgi:hypothetical protein